MATWLTPYHVGGVSLAALERTLRLCRDNGIEPILVGVPVTRWHRQNYTPAIEAAYRGEMDRLARAYDYAGDRGRAREAMKTALELYGALQGRQ